ncbi:germination protein GerKB [Clostridium polyendosporum]|uniref:Germination protein GerKB n=1 Tax=Clostridium polyendosporum TaxID=69208 RepID=A0A919RY67_9CLOT|nr:GerAB/ArcD/ProY family transporter [Clostridium polyendosporum]GIM27625.1 germination protein GerKB [Clostridium polyendosporum]
MKTKISAYQLFSAIVFVPYGSAVLFFINPEAKQDAWIAILFYLLPAVILQILYTSLWQKYPDDTIVTYIPKIFGRVIGYLLSLIYIIFFAYEAARVLRDFTELIAIAVMPKLPLIITSVALMIPVGYSVFKGIENVYRLTHIFLPLWVFFFIMEWIFLFTTPHALHFHHLKPVLENGIITPIKESWKLITFPYGESILFTMLFSSVIEVSKIRKAAAFAMIFQGILVALNTIMFISVLGTDFASETLFPLLQTLRVMKIGEAFDRVDILIVLIMVVGGFIKISFFMYGAMLGTAQLVKLKDTKYLAIPFSIVVLITSLLIAKNYPQHIFIGQVLTLTYIHLPLAIIIPIAALLLYYIKNLIKKRSRTRMK